MCGGVGDPGEHATARYRLLPGGDRIGPPPFHYQQITGQYVTPFLLLLSHCSLSLYSIPQFACPPPQKKDIQDDLLLEVVILCGTFALDEKCACLLVEAGVPNFLITILKGTV